jgi:hypothetical protein
VSNLKLKETDGWVIETHYRVTLDVKVLISEITRETLRQHWQWDENNQDGMWEQGGRQNRLLSALLENEEVLEKFLIYVIVSDLEGKLGIESRNGYQVEETEEILEPIYTVMAEEDAQFFREVRDKKIFSANTEIMEDCFVIDWDETKIKELHPTFSPVSVDAGRCPAGFTTDPR